MKDEKISHGLDNFMKITKIGFYIFITAALIVITINFARTMKVYNDIDINDVLDKVVQITDCQIEYKCNGEYLKYDGLCVDMEETFEFFKNMTQGSNKDCKTDIIKVVEKEHNINFESTMPNWEFIKLGN